MLVSADFNQCDDSDTRIDIGCQGGRWGESKNGKVASIATPSKPPIMTDLSVRAQTEVTTGQPTTLTSVGLKEKTNSQMQQTTLFECRPYHL